MNQVELLYQYIAASDPDFAKRICIKYGYTVPPVRNPRELGGLLRQLVKQEGEQAFIDILDHHPDRELILETYSSAQPTHLGADGSQTEKKGCGCKDCSEKHKPQGYLNADAAGVVAAQLNAANTNQHNAHQITSTQTGVVILACAVIISLAIMSKK